MYLEGVYLGGFWGRHRWNEFQVTRQNSGRLPGPIRFWPSRSTPSWKDKEEQDWFPQPCFKQTHKYITHCGRPNKTEYKESIRKTIILTQKQREIKRKTLVSITNGSGWRDTKGNDALMKQGSQNVENLAASSYKETWNWGRLVMRGMFHLAEKKRYKESFYYWWHGFNRKKEGGGSMVCTGWIFILDGLKGGALEPPPSQTSTESVPHAGRVPGPGCTTMNETQNFARMEH